MQTKYVEMKGIGKEPIYIVTNRSHVLNLPKMHRNKEDKDQQEEDNRHVKPKIGEIKNMIELNNDEDELNDYDDIQIKDDLQVSHNSSKIIVESDNEFG